MLVSLLEKKKIYICVGTLQVTMANTILLLVNTNKPKVKDIVEALNSKFGNPDIILYAVGRKRRGFKRLLNRLDIQEIIYDYDVSKQRPNQPDIDYLREFEDALIGNGTLNKCIAADRKLIKDGLVGLFNDPTKYDYEEVLSHVECRVRVLEELFDQYKFDLVYGHQVETVAGMITSELTKFYDISHISPVQIGIADRCILSENPYKHNEALWDEVERAKSLKDKYPTYNAAKEYVQQVREGGKLYWGTREYSGPSSSYIDKIVYLYDTIMQEKGGITTEYYRETPKIKYMRERLYKFMNKRYLENLYNFDSYDLDDEYIYFPLQAEPEIALMVWTTFFTNLAEIIRYVSKSVPITHQVFVNEHPVQWGARSKTYYNEINGIYNTTLIPISVDTRRLIKNSSCIVTVSSNVGVESLIYGVPVVSFGGINQAPPYANLESVKTVNDIHELPDIIHSSMNMEVDESEIIAYIAAVFNTGVPLSENNFYKSILQDVEI